MARVQSPPILSQIRVARSYSEQTAALRALKDDIVGHTQRKEKWIENGILESLVKNIQSIRSPGSRINDESRSNTTGQPRALTDSERVRLLSLELIASFASGGPSFLAPLHAVGSVPAILTNISPFENPPQIVLTALRALNDIADASLLLSPGSCDTTALSEQLFRPQHLNSLNRILDATSTAMVIQEQKCLVASLISRLCRGAHQQNLLANHGILDALATLLASFVVLRGEAVPGAEIAAKSDGLDDMIPNPAHQGVNLAQILEAISTIIADSRYRACMLVCSPTIMAIFPTIDFAPAAKEARAAWNALEMSGLSSIRARNPGAMDYLLPVIPITQSRSFSSQLAQFPPLGFSPSSDNLVLGSRPPATKFSGWDPTRVDSASSSGDAETEDSESPLIPWLIHLIRSTDGLERVMAASVLASLYKAGFAVPEREVAIGILVVPLLCRLIKDHDKQLSPQAQASSFIEPETALDWAILERTPAVLARLVADSDFLQQAANECGALKAVHKLLKDAYEPLPAQSPPRPWSPTPDHSTDQLEGLPSCRMGAPGQLPIYAHKIKMRESSLKLVAGLVAHKEEYRKAMAEQDILPFIVESLTATPSKPKSPKEKARAEKSAEDADHLDEGLYGINPNSVIIAACHVIRVLSRSVSNLRTTLEDHGVALPIFRLLKHPMAEVQIAACSAVCNLVLNCSPMREALLRAGILKVLCEHAHSENPGLRLNAMWALKALVEGAELELKKQALEELESGWLVRLICDDTEDEALHARTQLERSQDADDDEDMDVETFDDGSNISTYAGTQSMLRAASPRVQRAERKIATLREAELNPTRKARNDDLAIQEQGLNFIRNLISLPSSPGEMVDYIFNELGQDRLFEILASKLRAKVLHPFGRKYATSPDSRMLYPQAKVVEAVVYVLVNIAASVPRHRQLVIAQTELLKLLGMHISSRDTDVRRALCHLLGNLSEREGDTDVFGVEQRAMELRKLGFLAKLEELEKKDSDLDVRERAKAAVYKIKSPGPSLR